MDRLLRRGPAMISPAVQKFLGEYVDSAELLDILMLLHGERDQVWSPETVSNRVFTVPQAAQRRLEELKTRGLVTEPPGRTGSYKLDLKDAQMAAVLDELRGVYKANRASVITAVFDMKTDPLKSFSNAFKLRGDS